MCVLFVCACVWVNGGFRQQSDNKDSAVTGCHLLIPPPLRIVKKTTRRDVFQHNMPIDWYLETLTSRLYSTVFTYVVVLRVMP